MDIKKIIFYVVIIIVVFSLYKWLFRDGTTTNVLDMASGKKEKIVPVEDMKGDTGSTFFTYSMWVYISSWNYRLGQEKVLVERVGSDETESCPKIALAQNVNDLEITLASLQSVENSDSNSKTCVIKNIPLQKWTHILVTTNNHSLDTYIDGKLVKTCLLPGSPKINGEAELKVCPKSTDGSDGGFDGHIAKVRYYPKTLNPREAYELYKEGPSKGLFGNLMSKYKLKFSYYVDNKEEGTITI